MVKTKVIKGRITGYVNDKSVDDKINDFFAENWNFELVGINFTAFPDRNYSVALVTYKEVF